MWLEIPFLLILAVRAVSPLSLSFLNTPHCIPNLNPYYYLGTNGPIALNCYATVLFFTADRRQHTTFKFRTTKCDEKNLTTLHKIFFQDCLMLTFVRQVNNKNVSHTNWTVIDRHNAPIYLNDRDTLEVDFQRRFGLVGEHFVRTECFVPQQVWQNRSEWRLESSSIKCPMELVLEGQHLSPWVSWDLFSLSYEARLIVGAFVFVCMFSAASAGGSCVLGAWCCLWSRESLVALEERRELLRVQNALRPIVSSGTLSNNDESAVDNAAHADLERGQAAHRRRQ